MFFFFIGIHSLTCSAFWTLPLDLTREITPKSPRECPMDPSYTGKARFPTGVEYMGGGCTPPPLGRGSSKFDGARLESINRGRTWGA